jgi:hypothetical protein
MNGWERASDVGIMVATHLCPNLDPQLFSIESEFDVIPNTENNCT